MRPAAPPCLVVNGVFDIMIPVRNSYLLSEHLPNAVLLTYPESGHGSNERDGETMYVTASISSL
jgi:pimeloyl-ACP methyl ester carboxylesterase